MKTALKFKQAIRKFRTDLNADIREIKRALRDASTDVKSKARLIAHEAIENARNKSLAARDTAEDYIVEKPFKTVGFALIAGCLLGFLMRK
ncbi:MAG: hypothetical protein ACYCQI_13955 [Gammaproteobacteria bacterium]